MTGQPTIWQTINQPLNCNKGRIETHQWYLEFLKAITSQPTYSRPLPSEKIGKWQRASRLFWLVRSISRVDYHHLTWSNSLWLWISAWQALKGEGEGGIWAREGVPLLRPPSRVVSRPNSLPLPFRTPATQANSEDDYRTCCRNVSHCQQQQSYSGLHSLGRSYFTYLWYTLLNDVPCKCL